MICAKQLLVSDPGKKQCGTLVREDMSEDQTTAETFVGNMD